MLTSLLTDQPDQKQRYEEAYRGRQRLRKFLRFDIRHRTRRMHEVIDELDLQKTEAARILDVGFGGGDLLASFPSDSIVHGAEISSSAVERARHDPRFSDYREARFFLIRQNEGDLPEGPYDVVISSHTLEHVPDDRAHLQAIRDRLDENGLFFLFVPIEKPGYNPDHVRTFSVESVTDLVQRSGFDVLHSEGNNHMNGHVWKIITIPSRRRWPVLGPLVNGIRLWTLSLIPYPLFKKLNRVLDRLGAGPRQAFVVARKR